VAARSWAGCRCHEAFVCECGDAPVVVVRAAGGLAGGIDGGRGAAWGGGGAAAALVDGAAGSSAPPGQGMEGAGGAVAYGAGVQVAGVRPADGGEVVRPEDLLLDEDGEVIGVAKLDGDEGLADEGLEEEVCGAGGFAGRGGRVVLRSGEVVAVVDALPRDRRGGSIVEYLREIPLELLVASLGAVLAAAMDEGELSPGVLARVGMVVRERLEPVLAGGADAQERAKERERDLAAWRRSRAELTAMGRARGPMGRATFSAMMVLLSQIGSVGDRAPINVVPEPGRQLVRRVFTDLGGGWPGVRVSVAENVRGRPLVAERTEPELAWEFEAVERFKVACPALVSEAKEAAEKFRCAVAAAGKGKGKSKGRGKVRGKGGAA
jgi:hypothetical protein